jgi:serine/threonine-protein kinase
VSIVDADGGLAEDLPPNAPLGREFGKYRLTRRLARGGMGEVYLARLVGELGFERQLVIKTILPELAEKPRFIEMFAAEAKTAVALSHGNIVPAYELGRAADTFYIAMGYVDGPSVAQLLEVAQLKQLDPDIAAGLHVMRGVLAGLSYAHREEPDRPAVVHRDITPRNVLIDRSGQVRIVDFGIAAPARRQVGVRAGSIGYMSPEQARGDAADPRADVFSAGCLLYELCTHHRAFPKEGVWTSPVFDDVPEEVRGPLERALAIDPDERFKDASELTAALRGAFSKYGATYDDAALARTVAELFPFGWGRGDERESHDSGERPLLSGPSETYATRLTAVTGIDPNAAPPPEDAEAEAPSDAQSEASGDSLEATPDPTGPHPIVADAEAPTERSGVSARDDDDRAAGGIRVSSLAMVLGALGIGLAAFAIGRTESFAGDPPPARVAQDGPVASVPSTQSGVSTPAAPGPASQPAPDPTPPPATANEAEPAPVVQRLRVQPKTAAIEVAGEPVDGDALTLPLEGTVEVRVSAKGYKPKTLTLSAADASDEPLPVILEAAPTKPREPGGLRVLAPTVAWAEVRVDGKKVGNTPTRRISLASGRHRVEVRCVPDVCTPGRTLYKQSVTIEPGKLTKIDAK